MKRIVRTVVGSLVLLAGLAMLVLPGPALLVVPLGLAILAIDFAWARTVMAKAGVWFSRKNNSETRSPRYPSATRAEKADPQDLASSSQTTASGSGLGPS